MSPTANGLFMAVTSSFPWRKEADLCPVSSNHPCCRVLIVDDHSIMREGLKRLMPEAFEVVAEAATAREAFRVLEDRSLVIDVAVVDYGLPDFNGVDTAIKLLELRPSL